MSLLPAAAANRMPWGAVPVLLEVWGGRTKLVEAFVITVFSMLPSDSLL